MGESKINNRGYTDVMPAAKAFAITTSDSNDQLESTILNSRTKRSIAFMVYVGSTGDVSVVCADDGSSVVFKAVPTGTTLPVLVRRVNAAGTTASQLVGMY